MVTVREVFVYSSGTFNILVYSYTCSQGPFIEENVGQLVNFKKYKYITCQSMETGYGRHTFYKEIPMVKRSLAVEA